MRGKFPLFHSIPQYYSRNPPVPDAELHRKRGFFLCYACSRHGKDIRQAVHADARTGRRAVPAPLRGGDDTEREAGHTRREQRANWKPEIPRPAAGGEGLQEDVQPLRALLVRAAAEAGMEGMRRRPLHGRCLAGIFLCEDRLSRLFRKLPHPLFGEVEKLCYFCN